ncbi:uncharacterized protein [Penaeus vannamei]|uniref:uncharacterized protein n=1 Tax=Penaeus vannamei TaxID=6689 RepID=UPI00387F8C50
MALIAVYAPTDVCKLDIKDILCQTSICAEGGGVCLWSFHSNTFNSLVRRDKEQFIRSLAEEVEGHILVNDLRPAYQALRKLNSQALFTVSGQIVLDLVTMQEHLAEYFEQLYQFDSPTVNLDTGSAVISLPDPSTSEDPPSLTEVRGTVSKLRSGKAAGICGILAELLNAGGEPMAHYCIEFGHGLLAAYIDLKKAFETVHWKSLWEILRQRNSNKHYWTNSKPVY